MRTRRETMDGYPPKPIDTTQVNLPEEFDRLIESLAENNHDVWARQRRVEGRTFGKTRDDQSKKHPDLVPYKNLSESEKQYDRNSVIETLKAIIASGYNISRP